LKVNTTKKLHQVVKEQAPEKVVGYYLANDTELIKMNLIRLLT